MIGLGAFKTVRLVGSALPAEAVTRAAEGSLPGQRPADYLLPTGLTVSAAAARAWEVLLPAHQAWKAALGRMPADGADTKFTRDRWLLPLLYELGYGRPTRCPPALTSNLGWARRSRCTSRCPTSFRGRPTPQNQRPRWRSTCSGRALAWTTGPPARPHAPRTRWCKSC